MGPRHDTRTQFLDCSAISALVNHHCCGFTCVAISALVLSFVSIFFSLWIRVIFMCCYLVVHLALRGEARRELPLDVNILRFPESDLSVPCCFDASPARRRRTRRPSQRSARVCVSRRPWKRRPLRRHPPRSILNLTCLTSQLLRRVRECDANGNGYVLLPWTLVRKNTVPTFRGASE